MRRTNVVKRVEQAKGKVQQLQRRYCLTNRALRIYCTEQSKLSFDLRVLLMLLFSGATEQDELQRTTVMKRNVGQL